MLTNHLRVLTSTLDKRRIITLMSGLFASIRSAFGQVEKEPSPKPTPVTVMGVRIPADGTSPHLLPLTTISDSGATNSFLFHIPDLRQYWKTDQAWEFRDLQRLDLWQDEHIPRSHYIRQRDDLRTFLTGHHTARELAHLRQRYLLDQRDCTVQQRHSSCVGSYYVFYSYAVDDLPRNPAVPAWINCTGPGTYLSYFGDVFLLKMAPHEYEEEHGWAVYEDIDPQFLELLTEGPIEVRRKDIGSLRESTVFWNTSART